jgi:hypothetical protein
VILEAITAAAPGVDFSDPTWGFIEADQYSIEVNIGDADPVDSFALHVRGGDSAVVVIADILERLDLRRRPSIRFRPVRPCHSHR